MSAVPDPPPLLQIETCGARGLIRIRDGPSAAAIATAEVPRLYTALMRTAPFPLEFICPDAHIHGAGTMIRGTNRIRTFATDAMSKALRRHPARITTKERLR
jgi:hypothetical protein